MRYILIIFVSLILIVGCSKIKDNISSPEELKVHLEGINDAASNNFHGKLVKNEKWNFKLCKTCHGGNFDGGTVQINCTSCHKDEGGPLACNTCHGSFANPSRMAPPRDLSGNTANTFRGVGAHANLLYDNVLGKKVNCTECHYVPNKYDDPKHIDTTSIDRVELLFGTLANYRTLGVDATKKAIYNYNDNTCSNLYCHGYFKNGDTTNVVKWTDGSNGAKCGSCHGEKSSGKPTPGGTHFNFTGVERCQICHSSVVNYENNKYTFVNTSKHIDGNVDVNMSQLKCNSCHGDPNNASRISPPIDLSGNTSNTTRGVGAHVKHLYESEMANNTNCNECHYVPSSIFDPKHMDTSTPTRVELIFGTLANYRTPEVDPTKLSEYNQTTFACSNTYCHGYFKNGNLNNAVKWTDGSDGAKCGSCHGNVTTGNPAPTGTHPNFPLVSNCGLCHVGVFKYENNTYTIVNKTKHVNGVVDF